MKSMTEKPSAGYPVNEIFYSLQGEGYHSGTPAIFIRFSGCNLKCDFCDTDFSSHVYMTVDEIIEEVRLYPATVVVLTGGEPSLQPLGPLVESLHAEGKKLHMETNGTQEIPWPIDWITCSPKRVCINGKNDYLLSPAIFKRADEVKIVLQSEDGLEDLADKFGTTNFFIQPCSGSNIKEAIDYVLKNPRWRLSLQTHKMIDIP